jgi:hypothetical protein
MYPPGYCDAGGPEQLSRAFIAGAVCGRVARGVLEPNLARFRERPGLAGAQGPAGVPGVAADPFRSHTTASLAGRSGW